MMQQKKFLKKKYMAARVIAWDKPALQENKLELLQRITIPKEKDGISLQIQTIYLLHHQ